MDSTSSKSAGATVTPTKEKNAARSSRSASTENRDPNVSIPRLKFCRSPPIVRRTGNGAVPRKAKPNPVAFPPSTSSSKKRGITERKFVVAKRKSRKEGVEFDDSSRAAVVCEKCTKAVGGTLTKCFCVGYESLRASQNDVFKNRKETKDLSNIAGIDNEGETEENGEMELKKSRDRVMKAARQSVPESGSGRVMHLVMAFEKLRMISKLGDESEDREKKGMKWALPGLHQTRPKVSETQVSFNQSDLFLTPNSFSLDSGCSYSLESSQGSISTRTSTCGRKSRQSILQSNESSGTVTKRNGKRNQKRETTQKPFMLRTEQRGRSKEEQFTKKFKQMLEEEEKLRRHVAIGLPWTTDEPEFLSKPLVKENTRPADLVLHSDTRAVERTEFDNQVVMKMNLIEEYRLERERQQKQADEEEIRRLRKDLVPKAQPLPYFDRPFIPRRSMKQPTIPKDPKFHLPQYMKIKSQSSLDDLDTQLG